jgi:hypothetical protein
MNDPYNQPASSRWNSAARCVFPIISFGFALAALGLASYERMRSMSLRRTYLKWRYRDAKTIRSSDVKLSGSPPHAAWQICSTPRLREGDHIFVGDVEFIAYQVDVVGNPADMVFCQLIRA